MITAAAQYREAEPAQYNKRSTVAKKSNLIKLGDAINILFKQEKLDVRLAQFAVKNSWADIAGEMIAKNTTEISFNNKTLFIALSSAALKHELSFRKQVLIDNVNKFTGSKFIEELVIK
jgi:predicted nucleic acid-binding Zn ribbon protein